MTWTAKHVASLEGLRQVQGSLTVDLMMVERRSFETCSPGETAAQVKARNKNQFSFYPVVDENDLVVGLYHAARWFKEDAPDTPIADDFQHLSEDNVIGADASIFEFVMQADTNPTNLVVSGNKIVGLVSLSDLQKLPVRASLFELITSLEMAMAIAIERQWPKPQDWMQFLSDDRRAALKTAIKKAKARDGFVSEIAFAQLSDKSDIVRKGRLLEQTSTKLKKSFKLIRDLRDNVAHANNYAATPSAAEEICEVVRSIYETKAEMLNVIKKIGE